MIPESAVEAALLGWDKVELRITRGRMREALEAAAPHMLAAKVAEAKANNDHIVEGGDGYSAGFHYALHCVEGDAK